MLFTTPELKEAGFTGWIPFAEVRSSACPRTGGVYVVSYDGPTPHAFPPASCGGWFKGKDPSVPREALAANWVEGAEVVYIEKADQLKRRLIQFSDFGAGKPVGHWGGRLIWQLPQPEKLGVAWLETPGRIPLQVEAELLALFREAYGKPPFANDPHRMGV
jgi:hypothetical protein